MHRVPGLAMHARHKQTQQRDAACEGVDQTLLAGVCRHCLQNCATHCLHTSRSLHRKGNSCHHTRWSFGASNTLSALCINTAHRQPTCLSHHNKTKDLCMTCCCYCPPGGTNQSATFFTPLFSLGPGNCLGAPHTSTPTHHTAATAMRLGQGTNTACDDTHPSARAFAAAGHTIHVLKLGCCSTQHKIGHKMKALFTPEAAPGQPTWLHPQ